MANGVHREWTRIAAAAYHSRHPEAGSCHWQDEDASAVFAGEGNPLTQCYGLGAGDGDPEQRLDAVVRFFARRTSKWELILTPFEAAGVWNLAVSRGLRFDHFENLLYRPLDNLETPQELPPEMKIERIGESEIEAWGDLSIRAFCGEDVPSFAADLQHVLGSAPNSRKYWGTWEGVPVAAASYSAYEKSVFLGGMGTLEAYRGRGFQGALLNHRLQDAAREAEIALVEALPGSSSHRNIERRGFRVAYTSAVLVCESGSAI